MKPWIAILPALLLPTVAMAADGQYETLPGGSVQETAHATTAASTNTAILAGAVNRTTYLDGVQITGGGATGAGVIACNISGIQGGNITLDVAIPAGNTTGISPLFFTPKPPLISSTPNGNITVSCPSFGAGNLAAAVSAEGYVF